MSENLPMKNITNKINHTHQIVEPSKDAHFQLSNSTKHYTKEIELEKQHSRPSLTHQDTTFEIQSSSKNKRKSSLLNGDALRDRRKSKAFRLSTD